MAIDLVANDYVKANISGFNTYLVDKDPSCIMEYVFFREILRPAFRSYSLLNLLIENSHRIICCSHAKDVPSDPASMPVIMLRILQQRWKL